MTWAEERNLGSDCRCCRYAYDENQTSSLDGIDLVYFAGRVGVHGAVP